MAIKVPDTDHTAETFDEACKYADITIDQSVGSIISVPVWSETEGNASADDFRMASRNFVGALLEFLFLFEMRYDEYLGNARPLDLLRATLNGTAPLSVTAEDAQAAHPRAATALDAIQLTMLDRWRECYRAALDAHLTKTDDNE